VAPDVTLHILGPEMTASLFVIASRIGERDALRCPEVHGRLRRSAKQYDRSPTR
jgi:hypothetical protein